MKLARIGRERLPMEGGSARGNLLRGFMHAAAQLMEQHGAFDIPDTLRIDNGLTWGQAKEMLAREHAGDGSSPGGKAGRVDKARDARDQNTLQNMRQAADAFQASPGKIAQNLGRKLAALAANQGELRPKDMMALRAAFADSAGEQRKLSSVSPLIKELYDKYRVEHNRQRE
jgi:hypothetical protein